MLYRHRGTTASDFLEPLTRSFVRDDEEPASVAVGTMKSANGKKRPKAPDVPSSEPPKPPSQPPKDGGSPAA